MRALLAPLSSLLVALAAGAGVDTDGDTVPDEADNCPTRANAEQEDVDSDGFGDICDNCSMLAQTFLTMCDSDSDGYGNACDGDFANVGAIGIPELNVLFVPRFLQSVPPAEPIFDLNCDGAVGIIDFNVYFIPQLLGQPGPSGLPCAGSIPCLP